MKTPCWKPVAMPAYGSVGSTRVRHGTLPAPRVSWPRPMPLMRPLLARMARLFHARMRRYEAPQPWQRELRDWLRRRGQVVVTLQAQKQQTALTSPAVRRLMALTIAALKRELAAIDAAMQALLKVHGSPALRSSKGMGPIFQATSLALLPELGRLSRQQIAKLVGVAPMNRDSGQTTGKRRIRGGRAPVRVALYMATLSAVRWDPVMRAHYQQLTPRGRIATLAAYRHLGVTPPQAAGGLFSE